MAIAIPKPSILDDFDPVGAPYGRKRWRSAKGKRLYEWDDVHGEIEVYDGRGFHLGAMDPAGRMTKPAVKGRRIDV